MLLIRAENSLDNRGMFWFLLTSAYTESRPFQLLMPPHQQVGWGCTMSWKGTQPGQLTPKDQRDTPDHIMSHFVIKTWGKTKGGRENSGILVFVFPTAVTCVMEPCFPEDG